MKKDFPLPLGGVRGGFVMHGSGFVSGGSVNVQINQSILRFVTTQLTLPPNYKKPSARQALP